MTAELWLKTPCEHGELDSHHVGDEYELCEDQGWMRLDPDKAVSSPRLGRVVCLPHPGRDRRIGVGVMPMDSPPNYPVIVVHADDGNGLTACTGQPMPRPVGDVYRNVPRYFCQACARVRGGGISADVLAYVRTLPGVEEVVVGVKYGAEPFMKKGPFFVDYDYEVASDLDPGRYLIVPLSEEE